MPKKLVHAQRRKIAAGKVSGRKNRDIARDAGVSESTVQHAAQDPETLSYMAEFSAAAEEDLRRAFAIACRKMRVDVGSKSAQTRALARRDLLGFVTAADRARGAKNAGGAGEYELKDLLVAWHAVKIEVAT
jgi:hypothetical protein